MLIFIFGLLLGIIIHEAAHFIAAKSVKCEVSVFSIGFGRPFFKRKIGETTYQITPYLFGGYCALKHEFEYSRRKYAFTNLPYNHKMRIILAGVTVNIIFGLIMMLIGLDLNYSVWYIGYLNMILGLGNLIPFPALDGSYVFLVWLEKLKGKKQGYALMGRICNIGMKIINILNILCIPALIWWYRVPIHQFIMKTLTS